MIPVSTIDDRVRTRDNCFSLVRLIAASLVIFSHCYPLSGNISAEPLARLVGILDLATVAVICFFVISGFLVAQSAVNSRSVTAFVAARFLRIWPGLALAALVTALLLGPIASTLSPKAYFSAAGTWLYLLKIPFLDVGAYLPGVFEKNPLPRGVNGSLWTIQIEVWLYVLVAIMLAVKAFRNGWFFLLFPGACVFLFLIYPEVAAQLYPRSDEYMASRLIGCFFLGATMYVFRSRIYLSPLIGCALLALCWSCGNTQYFTLAFYVTFAYLTILIALAPANSLSRLLDRVDLSYGVYIFAFPVQQLIVSLCAPLSPMRLFFLSYSLTILLAWFSWHFVESRALSLKKRF